MQCENCGHDGNPDGARFCAGCGGPLPFGPNDATDPLIGKVVGGRYHIVGRIGEGGMGVVYKAEQRLGSTVRKVAVKTLHAELSRDPAITARFHREVGTIAQLEHPNTVRVYDFGATDDGTLYIAMEFLDGRALNRVIEAEGALEPRRVAHLLRQIAGSLDEAHRQGIIHRDLKPENVLLIERAGEKDVVKLVDFGIAARTESSDRAKEQKLTQQGMVLGTPPYMSPEQFTGRALDARTDVYSLGIMVYEMLTGQLPFQADTPWQWATHHMTSAPRSFDEVPSGSRLPEALRKAVLKALSKDPQDRQSSAGEFHNEFSAALAGTASLPPRPATAAVAAGNKTEAMPEATPFAVAATEAMPAAAALGALRSAAASPPAPVALPAAPAAERRAAGGRGLIYGLSGLGAVLAIAIAVVALGGKGSDGPTAAVDTLPAAESPAPATIAPISTAEPTEIQPDIPEPAPVDPSPPAPKPPSKSPATTKPASSSSTPSHPAPAAASAPKPPPPAPSTTPSLPPGLPHVPGITPPATTAPSVPPAAPPAAPAAGGDACSACWKAATDGNVVAAADAYAKCANRAHQKQCTAKVASGAVRQAESAAYNGQCPLARSIMTAAVQMGVPQNKFRKAESACK